jgi:acyl transferase domain-containing protein
MKEDVAAFDTSFFSITAEEAAAIDPQHRLLLETSYRAIENGTLSNPHPDFFEMMLTDLDLAGIPLEKALGSKTAVYSGSMANDYSFTLLKDLEDMPKYSVTGVAMSLVANRLSWFFDFRGPSINLDSACSSSLMGLDIACQGLRNGDSSMVRIKLYFCRLLNF